MPSDWRRASPASELPDRAQAGVPCYLESRMGGSMGASDGGEVSAARVAGAGEDETVLFTVNTSTFNRAHTLPRTYESLRQQTLRSFEWVVVDDGSTDGTKDLVRSWIEEAP